MMLALFGHRSRDFMGTPQSEAVKTNRASSSSCFVARDHMISSQDESRQYARSGTRGITEQIGVQSESVRPMIAALSRSVSKTMPH